MRKIERDPRPLRRPQPNGAPLRGVFLVEESRVVRAALRRLFDRAGPYPVIGDAAELSRALPMLASLRPSVLVLDPFASSGVSPAWLRGLCSSIDAAAIVATFEEQRAADELACDGFLRAIVSKESDPDELLHALRAVERGECYVCPRITRKRALHVAR